MAGMPRFFIPVLVHCPEAGIGNLGISTVLKPQIPQCPSLVVMLEFWNSNGHGSTAVVEVGYFCSRPLT